MLNKTYSILTDNVNPVSIQRSEVVLTDAIKHAKSKLISSEDEAFVCLLLFTYSDYRRRLTEGPTSYFTENLVINISATAFIKDKLNSDAVTLVLNLGDQDDREEYSTLKSDLDKLGFLTWVLVKAVE